MSEDVFIVDEPIHDWFSLTYSSYLVIPRLALQSMPIAWQRRLVVLLDEASDAGLETPSDYEVRRRDERGRFIEDPWRDYRRGNFVEVHGKPLNPSDPGI